MFRIMERLGSLQTKAELQHKQLQSQPTAEHQHTQLQSQPTAELQHKQLQSQPTAELRHMQRHSQPTAELQHIQRHVGRGRPQPYGCSEGSGDPAPVNFSIVAPGVQSAWLLLECPQKQDKVAVPQEECGSSDWPAILLKLAPSRHRSGHVWHVEVLAPFQAGGRRYAWLLDPPLGDSGRPLKSAKRVLDPCARLLDSPSAAAWNSRDGPKFSPSACVPDFQALQAFNWEDISKPHLQLKDLVIYEAHVRSFTKHPDSGVLDGSRNAGTFRGFLEKIPHLIRLGVNCVELLPIFEFDETACPRTHPKTKEHLCNYWGYSTCAYYAPMQRFASRDDVCAAVVEFKTLVRELHRYGIEVVLDVVFNHTGEGAWGERNWHSLCAIAEAHYYLMSQGQHTNYTGCGNTVNANDPVCTEWIIDCLRYWATEMQVDGFRFDLASALTRGSDGQIAPDPFFVRSLAGDPMLAHVKLIAEPWDCSWPDGYLVGKFPNCGPPRFAEWNGKFRDAARRFIKGDEGMTGEFATRLCGSADLYEESGRGPCHSINFIAAHDGFTLRDLVSYNHKRNSCNSEESGEDNNMSWNCGDGPSFDGPVLDPEVVALRERQMRNLMVALFLSAGTPMLLMGDEYGRTQGGNNNTWCQDAANWFSWEACAEEEEGLVRFCRLLISFRKHHADIFSRTSFLTSKEIHWTHDSWDDSYNFISFVRKSAADAQPSGGYATPSTRAGSSARGNETGSFDCDAASVAYTEPTGSSPSVAGSEAGANKSGVGPGRFAPAELLIAFNAGHVARACDLPAGRTWYRLIDTSLSSPMDFCESDEDAQIIAGENYTMTPYSCIVLKSYQHSADACSYGDGMQASDWVEGAVAELRCVASRSVADELLPRDSQYWAEMQYGFESEDATLGALGKQALQAFPTLGRSVFRETALGA